MYASLIYQESASSTSEYQGNPDQVIRFIKHPGKATLELISRTRKAGQNLTRSDKF